MLAEAVLCKGLFGNTAEARRHDDSTNLKGPFFRFLTEINSLALAHRHTDLAGFMRKMQAAARINIIRCWYRLGIINVDGTGYIQTFVVIIHLVPRTVSGAKPAGCTVVGIDITGTLYNVSFKITWFSLEGKQITVCENLYIWRPTGLNQLGRQDSERTVVGREGLVKLSHNAADGR